MKKRSGSYPSKTIFETKDFVVSVYNGVGDTLPLKYPELAKYGNVAVREADSFAVSANQYGWMTASYGKGHTPNGNICKILRKPQVDEEKQLFLTAFTTPPLYKSIITDYNGKEIPSNETVEIYLSRNHSFSDAGATLCAKIFLENARRLGLIGSDNVFKIDAEIIITPPEPKAKKTKEGNDSGGKKKTPPPQNKNVDTPIFKKPEERNDSKLKNIPLFVRGRELHLSVLEDMAQSDWDVIIKQLQNIKAYSK